MTDLDRFRRQGLYYPYFHLRNERWLKVAALYWPKIIRIVPEDYRTHDSDTVQALIDELDFIDRQPPGPSVSAIAPRFRNLLGRYHQELNSEFGMRGYQEPKSRLTLRGKPRYADIKTRLPIPDSPPEQQWRYQPHASSELFGPMPGQALGAVRSSQIDFHLSYWLVESGLAVMACRDDDPEYLNEEIPCWGPNMLPDDYAPWLVMDERLASVYTSLLAENFATANHLQLITDQPKAYSATNNWAFDSFEVSLFKPHKPQMAAGKEELAEVLGFLALNLIVPDNLEDIPIRKIIEIRKRYGEEFLAFGVAVNQAAADLANLTDIRDQPALDRYLKDEVANRFIQPMNDLRRQLRSLKLDAMTMAINVKTELPLGAGVVGGAVLAGRPLIAGTSAAALGLLAMRRGLREQRDAKLQSAPEASFLLYTREHLEARGLLAETIRRLQQIAGISSG
jgi:hypothetical protein